jgi:hypothetical protein
LQSIIGAPVFSRRSFTCVAEIFTVVVPIAKNLPSLIYQPASTNFDPRREFSKHDPRGSKFKRPVSFQLATDH